MWNCSFWAISPFSTIFSKAFLFNVSKWVYMEERVNMLPDEQIQALSKLKAFADEDKKKEKNCGSETEILLRRNGKHCEHWLPAFSAFQTLFSTGVFSRVAKNRHHVGILTMFSTLSKYNCTIWATLKLSSANSFNLDYAKIMSSCKGTPLPYNTAFWRTEDR